MFFFVKMSDLDTRKNLKSLAGRELKLKDMSYFRQLLRNIGIRRKSKRFSRINLLWENSSTQEDEEREAGI